MLDDLEKFLTSDSELNRALTSSLDQETRQTIESQIANEMAVRGRMAPGWRVDRDRMGQTRACKDRFKARYGIHGGELAALVQAGLLMIVESHISSIKPAVQVEICARLDYCNRIRHVSDKLKDWDAVTSAAGWLIEKALEVPFPPLALGVFLVKRGILDKWCECKDEEPHMSKGSAHQDNQQSKLSAKAANRNYLP